MPMREFCLLRITSELLHMSAQIQILQVLIVSDWECHTNIVLGTCFDCGDFQSWKRSDVIYCLF